jgi:hypothetical protein
MAFAVVAFLASSAWADAPAGNGRVQPNIVPSLALTEGTDFTVKTVDINGAATLSVATGGKQYLTSELRITTEACWNVLVPHRIADGQIIVIPYQEPFKK